MEELLGLLFKQGYTWPRGNTNIDFLEADALYIDSGVVRVSLTPETFDADNNIEISIQDLKRHLNPTLRSLLEE